MTLVPVRYTGFGPRILKNNGGGRITDADGNPLATNLVTYGQTLMVPDTEAFGYTEKYATFGLGEGRVLGVGRVFERPEHEQLSPFELRLAGYVFHEGRSDFEPLVPPAAPKKSPKKPEKEGGDA